MPRRLASALALLLAFTVLAPDGAAAGSGDVVLDGEYVLEHGDEFATGRASFVPVLRTARGDFRLPARGIPAHISPGAKVRVVGAPSADRTIAVADGSVQQLAAPSEPTAAASGRRIGVIAFNFSTDARAPWSTDQVRSSFFSAARNVAGYFAEQSHGAMQLSGAVHGWYTIGADRSTCAYSTWASAARTAATAAGVDLSVYSNVVYLFPQQSTCRWAGLASLPGASSWLNGTINWTVAAHELGHNFGAHHASTTNCTSNGVRVSLSTTCTDSEYGDAFDRMGFGTHHFNNWHRRQVGHLSVADQRTITASGTYALGVASSSTPSAPRILRIPRNIGDTPATFLYLELRQPYGSYDAFAAGSPAVSGVSIRIAPDTARHRSRLIDTTPATTTFGDAPLAVGRSFTDPIAKITIKTVSVGSTGATVQVTLGPDTAAPSGVTNLKAISAADGRSAALSWSAASDNVGAAAYRISRNGAQVASVSGTSWTDAGLLPGTGYTWSVVAVDAAGNIGPAATTSATMPLDRTPPTAPGSLSARAVSTSQINLAWTVASDNVGVTGYRVRRNGTLVATLAASATAYSATGLSAGTSHTFSVAAIDRAGNVGPAASATATTPAIDTTPPSAPTSLTAAVRGTNATLAWRAASDNVRVAGYRVYRDGRLIATTTSLRHAVKMKPGTRASFHIAAFDAAGNVGRASNTTIVTTRR